MCFLVLVLPEEMWIQKYTLAPCHVTWCKHVNCIVGLMCLEREGNTFQIIREDGEQLILKVQIIESNLLSCELVVCLFVNKNLMLRSVFFVSVINIRHWCKCSDCPCDRKI